MALMTVFLLLSAAFAWFYYIGSYWRRRGVPYIFPVPIFGVCLVSILSSAHQFYNYLYTKFPDKPYLGVHFFNTPVLILRCPDLISKVMTDHYQSFASHGMYINKERDVMGNSVFHLEGNEWKTARTMLSPLFSPNRVRNMLQYTEESFAKFIDYIERTRNEESPTLGEVELHSASIMFAADLTASAIFGVDSKIFESGTKSPYYLCCKDFNSPISIFKALISYVSPTIYDLLKLQSFSYSANKFITDLVRTAYYSRLSSGPLKNDFIDQMVKVIGVKKEHQVEFAVSQGAVLWIGGVETTATTISFALYELAVNQHIQTDIRNNLENARGAKIIKDKPFASILCSLCSQGVLLKTDGAVIEKGTLVLIPSVALHKDPKHFPEPEEFNLERDYPRGAYTPFGDGPRICLGRRMGQGVVEEALRKLLTKFVFHPGHLCRVPISLKAKSFFTSPDNGIWLRVEDAKHYPKSDITLIDKE